MYSALAGACSCIIGENGEKNKEGGGQMTKLLELEISEDEQKEIEEFISTLLLIPKEDRAVLLSNANTLKVRRDIEKARSK